MSERRSVSTGSPYEPIIILTRIEDWRAVAEVHGEVFREVRPVNTIMQVSRFVDPDWLVETEVDAVVESR